MWQQQQLSDSAEKLVIFFLFLAFFAVCVRADVLFECVECSVAVCVIAYVGVSADLTVCTFGGVFHWSV